MAAYLEAALQEGDPRVVTVVLGDIARAKSMTKSAENTGSSTENT